MIIKFNDMKVLNKILFLFICGVATVFSSCKEDIVGPLENNTNKPGQVSGVTVENGPGNATISYKLPNDKDLLYVKAVYNLANGQEMEVKSSYYNNSLLVEGFGDTNLHDVKLYSVSRSEIASDPIVVKVKPLENPIWGVYKSLKVIPDFSGLNFKASNPSKADIVIEVLKYQNGKYVGNPKDNLYTSAQDIDNSLRGITDTTAQKFAVTVRDRWLNYSDTLYTTLKPLYETILSKSFYRSVSLPTDVGQQYSGTSLSKMWDGDIINWPNISLTNTGTVGSQWVTFDMGQSAILSRIVIWNYPEYLNSGRMYYYGGNLKKFEIWGSDNPAADGSYTNWKLLGSFDSKKPSGSAYGVQTAEDYTFANNGISYTFPAGGNQKVRYLRIKSISNWQGTTFMSIAELQCYGDPR